MDRVRLVSALSDEDRESLRHVVFPPHYDDANLDIVADVVEAIVQRAVATALTEAADEIGRYADAWSDDIEFVATALTKATAIVRARVPN